MGFLATLTSLFVAGALSLSLRQSVINPPIKVVAWRKWIPVAAVAIIVVLSFIFLPTDPLIARFSDLAKTESISADTRARIWADTVGLVKAYPIFGCGLGGYESAFMRYKTVAPMSTVDYAHNDYLQVMAEMGFVGFAIGITLALRVLYAAARTAFYARSADERYLAIASLSSLIAILLHSMVDFNMYVPANAFAVAWIAGIASTRLSGRRRATPVS